MAESGVTTITAQQLRDDAQRLIEAVRSRVTGRLLIGIAGVPASGKSTLAGMLYESLEALSPGIAAMAPLDGFHFCNDELQRRELLDRKGAPQTFDFDRYLQAMCRVSFWHDTLRLPLYDRQLHNPCASDDRKHHVDHRARVVITEGNYLLLEQQPWTRLEGVLDEIWWLSCDVLVARQRLIERHIRGGRTRDSATAHVEKSDDLNTRLIVDQRREPSRVVAWPSGS